MPADQARRGAALACALLLAGCSGGVPQDLDPRFWWRNVSGGYLDGREPPPGRDAPYPNLSSVPPRPVPPTAADRAALSAALAADRAGSRAAITDAPAPASRTPGAPAPASQTPGALAPAPPTLASVPAIRLEAPPARATPVVVVPSDQAGPAAQAGPAPAPPPLSGPPPAPMGDLLAPPPPPGADLLAPRGN